MTDFIPAISDYNGEEIFKIGQQRSNILQK